MTRSKALQVWAAVVVLVVVAAMSSGASVTLETALLLAGLSLVPAAMILMLWPRPLTQTAGDVLRGTERRG